MYVCDLCFILHVSLDRLFKKLCYAVTFKLIIFFIFKVEVEQHLHGLASVQ